MKTDHRQTIESAWDAPLPSPMRRGSIDGEESLLNWNRNQIDRHQSFTVYGSSIGEIK